MVSLRVLTGINGWFMSKQAQGANLNPKVVPLISLMFGTLDALYVETRKLPLPFVTSGANNNKPKDKPDVFTLGLFFQGQTMLLYAPFWL
jgi:hypothetical protein